MPIIVLDTDFLIKITNDPLPSFDLVQLSKEYDLATLPLVLRELRGLARNEVNKTSKRARNTLRFLDEGPGKVRVNLLSRESSSDPETDSELVEFARDSEDKVVIATLDHSLLSRLEKLGVSYLTLKNNKPILKRTD